MATTARRKERLHELDALRGIGALAVMLFHYSTRFHQMFPQARHVPFDFVSGNYRVLLFFVISGFAIFFSLNHVRRPADFVVNRVSRLFPAYWVALMLTLGFEYAADIRSLEIPPVEVLANFTMMEGFLFLHMVDGAHWTLTVELGFYASILFLWMTGATRRLEYWLIAWLGLRWFWLLMFVDMPERIIMLTVLRFVPFFVIGMALGRIWNGQRRWTQQVHVLGFAMLTLAMFETWDIVLAGAILIAIFSAMMTGRLRWICARPLLWVGSISYSLYLVHQNIGFVIMLICSRWGMNPWVGFAVAVLTAFGLGYTLNRFVERPAQRAIDRWWKGRQARDTAPVAA